MAFTAITSAQISAGEPVRQELWTITKDNFDDHEARLVTVEGALNAFPAWHFGLQGPYGLGLGVLTNIDNYRRITFNITITAVRLIVITAGSSGSTEIDVLFKRGAGAFTSILSTRASVASGAGNDAISTNAVLDGTNKFLQAGDLIRCDLTASQGGNPRSIMIAVEYDKT